MRAGATIENKNRLYGNIQVYSPDMQPMFKANMKKINWYLKNPDKKLAEVVEWDDDNTPKSIKLNFIPNGLGYFNNGLKDEYFLSDKENICVVTGTDEWRELTKHHIVPYMYRKWFPEEYKSSNCYDIVLITREKHYEYEAIANYLKDRIADELGIPTLKEYTRRISRKAGYVGMANAILNVTIPLEHKIDLCIKFRNKTGYVPTKENLNEYIKSCKNEYRMAEYYGKMVVEKIPNFQKFIERWRQHFLDEMNPKFMPKGWKVDRDMYL